MINKEHLEQVKIFPVCDKPYKDSLKGFQNSIDIIIKILELHNCEFLTKIINELNLMYVDFSEYMNIKGINDIFGTDCLENNIDNLSKELCKRCLETLNIEDM
ncbi:hypothetical protein ES702_00714 [subsurface metagenome]